MDQDFKKKFLKGSVATTAGTAFSMILHFISVIILTREMSVLEFGVYSLALATCFIMSNISSLGVEVTFVKFISSENTEEKDFAFSATMLVKFFSSSLMAILFYAGSKLLLPFTGKGLTDYVSSITILFFFGTFRDHFFNLLQGLNLFRKYAAIQFSSALIRVLSIILLLALHKITLANLLIVEISTTSLTLLILILNAPLKKIYKPVRNLEIIKKIFRFSTPIYFNNVFSMIYGRVNYFIIAALLNPAGVAYYDIAGKIPDALKKLYDSFILVYFPSFTKLLTSGHKEDSEKLMNKSLGSFSILISIIVYISYLFNVEITKILFTTKYLQSSTGMVFLLFNFLLIANNNIIGYSLVSAGFPKIPMRINIISSVISIMGSFLFIPIWGYLGTIYALLIMNIIALIQYYYSVKKIDIKMKLSGLIIPLSLLLLGITIQVIIGVDKILFKILFSLIYIFINIIIFEDFRQIFLFIKKMLPIKQTV